MKNRLYVIKKLCSVLLTAAIITITVIPVFAWSQPVHKAINDQAINLFKRQFSSSGKYKTAPIDYKEFYKGTGISDSFWVAAKYKATARTLQLPEWIVNGGDWADEPQWYAATRHFYDPMALSGVHYLTDQMVVFGHVYDQPQIDAVTWALSHNDNPFNWQNALVNYKKAMEIPEDGKKPGTIKGQHFKLNIAIKPKNRKEEREYYLAYAYRAMGETMHLIGDMVQPAHVRNDSHPRSEPLEDTITADNVREFAANSSVDARMTDNFLSAGGSRLYTPENLFFVLSSFTNKNFYSSDTIYDQENSVMPENEEIPIPSPQFKDLIPGEMELNGETIQFLGTPFLNDVIPMIQEKVSGRIFKSKSYFVPSDNNFTKKMGSVLIPIAIAACSDLMHQFYPTLELQTKFEEPERFIDELNGKPTVRYGIEATGIMIHKVEADQAWEEAGLSISYTGAGDLVFENNGKSRKIIPLAFENGELSGMQNSDKEWSEEPLILYLQQNRDLKLSKEEAYTAIEDGDSVYIRINAGSRTWTGIKMNYKFPVETLEADYTEHGLREEEGYPGFGVREFAAYAEAVNFDFEDTGDNIYLDPLYTGIVDLVFEDEKGSVKKIIPVWFEDGELSKIRDTEGRMINEPLLLYGDETAEYKLTDMEKMYEIEKDQSVYFRIRIANNKYLKSASWSYNQADEEIDGFYNGNLTIGATQKLRDFIVNAFSYILYPIANGILAAMGEETKSIEEIRSAVDSSITSETANAEITLSIVTESGNKVLIDFTVYDEEGNPTITSTKGTYQNGQLKFEGQFDDGSVLEMTGWLRGDTLSGTIEGSAWGTVTQAIEGNWTATRIK
ncbi:MAG: hypothetical protein ACYCWE_12130 [Eubacteriales bacterium]